MTRPRKKLEISEVRHPKRTAPVKVLYDRDSKEFVAVVDAATTITKPTQKECERAAYEAVTARTQLVWQQVIVVECLAPFGHQSDSWTPFVGFNMRKHEITQLDNDDRGYERWIERDFRDPDENVHPMRAESREHEHDVKSFWHPGERTNSDSRWVLLPYSKELWVGLSTLQESIARASERLTALLSSPDAVQKLSSISTPKLLGPAHEEDVP